MTRFSATTISRRGLLKASGSGLALAGLATLVGCGPAAENGDQQAQNSNNDRAAAETLGDGKTLRVGMEAAYAPYNWQVSEASDTTIPIDNVSGAFADGYDVQVAKRIAAAFGMEAVAVKMSFSGLVDALNNGQIDIICAGMSVTPERAKAIDFSDSYLDDDISVVVRADSPFASATTLADLTGASVVGQKDTMFDDVIEQIPGVNHLTPVATVPNVVENLQAGTCDAATFSKMSLPRLLADNPGLVELKLTDGFQDSLMPDNAGIAKGQTAALAKINEAISAISLEERQQLWNDCMSRQPA